MSTRHLVDPELREFFDNFPTLELSDETVGFVRLMDEASIRMAPVLPDSVTREEIYLTGHDGAPKVRALIYKPVKSKALHPAFLHMHGGGMVLGKPEQTDIRNVELCGKLGIVILSVDYRLAPENPFPAALHDCYAGLAFLHQHATDLGIDSNKIAIGGESAGGGLAASLSLFARDKADYAICHQQLVYPMLDCETGKNGSQDNPNLGEFCWTRGHNIYGWSAYLNGAAPHEAYVPMAMQDLANLPPTWICTGDLDLFLPENKLYKDRLTAAGIAVKFDVYTGAPHAFNAVREANVTKQFEIDFAEALMTGLEI